MRLVNLTINGSGARTIVNLEQVANIEPLLANAEHSVLYFAVVDPTDEVPYEIMVQESLAEIWAAAREAMQ